MLLELTDCETLCWTTQLDEDSEVEKAFSDCSTTLLWWVPSKVALFSDIFVCPKSLELSDKVVCSLLSDSSCLETPLATTPCCTFATSMLPTLRLTPADTTVASSSCSCRSAIFFLREVCGKNACVRCVHKHYASPATFYLPCTLR